MRSGLAGLLLEIYGYLIFAVLSSNDAYYVVWMISFGYMAGSFESWEEATDKVKRDLWPAMLAAWRVWPFYTFISMYFLPEEWWMPVGYFVGYCFNTYLKLLSPDLIENIWWLVSHYYTKIIQKYFKSEKIFLNVSPL